jgi:hypothetical protein
VPSEGHAQPQQEHPLVVSFVVIVLTSFPADWHPPVSQVVLLV